MTYYCHFETSIITSEILPLLHYGRLFCLAITYHRNINLFFVYLYVVNLYNDIGLTYVQCRKFDVAADVLTLALDTAYSLEGNLSKLKLAAVLQNLGAAKNSLGLHKEAISYNREAANIYGKVILPSLHFR